MLVVRSRQNAGHTMETLQFRWTPAQGWDDAGRSMADAQLVFVFADNPYFQTPACFEALRQRFPQASLLGCSTAGNVQGTCISDGDVTVTALRFARSRVRLVSAELGGDVAHTTASLIAQLQADDLRHVFVLLDGEMVDGSEFILGLRSQKGAITGGIAGDGERFGATWVMADACARRSCIAAVGFYGEVSARSTCFGGWQEFGPERRVTRSRGKLVMEIDGQPALALYKKYLGELAQDLPRSGQRFPMGFKLRPGGDMLIRSVMAVDEAAQSLSFAGYVPEGSICRLMRIQRDDLMETAFGAADAMAASPVQRQGLCLVVSCIGRRLVLSQMVEAELEVVQDRLGPGMRLAGFYSYGELAPHGVEMECQLHNQTLVLTTLHE